MSEMYLSHAIRTRNRPSNPGIYIVRDGRLVLYVGKARKPRFRLWEHVHSSFAGVPTPSPLGLLVMANEPESLRWRVEIIDSEWESIEQLERETIARLRPCLNRSDNPNARRLPKRYRRLSKWQLIDEWRRDVGLAT